MLLTIHRIIQYNIDHEDSHLIANLYAGLSTGGGNEAAKLIHIPDHRRVNGVSDES